ncbi:MAG: hypothetical protein KAG18_08170, partial [Sinobacterium sp.]|nr:hypothetical protein [Sinobacterium sp.]
DSNGILYRFNVKQGLQRKSAEISLRTLLAGTATAHFPATSTDRQLEVDTLEALTLFLSGHEAQTAYSYAALGISTIKRIAIKRNSDSGIKYLLVTEQEMRTKASLKQALTGANFQIVTLGQNSTVEARYMPQLPEEDQPGFFLRMFGVSAKLFDDEIEYAGETYIISLKAGETVQTISIDKDPSFEWESTSSKKRELNAILMMIKRSLY